MLLICRQFHIEDFFRYIDCLLFKLFFRSDLEVSALSPFIKLVDIDWSRWVILFIIFGKLLGFWSSAGCSFLYFWIISSDKERLFHQIFCIMGNEYLFWMKVMFLFFFSLLLFLILLSFLRLFFYLIYFLYFFIFSLGFNIILLFVILLFFYFLTDIFHHLLLFFFLYFFYLHLFYEALPNRLL